MTRAGPLLAIALAAAACGVEPPTPHVRLAGATPSGPGAPVDVACRVRFTGPIPSAGLTRIVLVPAAAASRALGALEGEGPAAAAADAVAAHASLEDGGRTAVLAPLAPLRGRAAYALVVASTLEDRDGRPVLDAAGRQRGSVLGFETAPPPGPPPAPVLTELLADAETPEAGGEYAEVANLGEGALDLLGWRLAKRTASGATASCLLEPGLAEILPPGGVALLAGGAWDGRYEVPAATPVLRCGAGALLGGLANEQPPALALVDPDGAVETTLGEGTGAPRCGGAVVRLDVGGPDAPGNLGCAEPTPGWLE